MPFTRITGSYVTHPLHAPERTADWEDFILTCNPDGSRTAMTLSRFPGNSIVRQVMQTVEADFTPRVILVVIIHVIVVGRRPTTSG